MGSQKDISPFLSFSCVVLRAYDHHPRICFAIVCSCRFEVPS
jgi:hypothetical protein